jgi:hypothetical protein
VGLYQRWEPQQEWLKAAFAVERRPRRAEGHQNTKNLAKRSFSAWESTIVL